MCVGNGDSLAQNDPESFASLLSAKLKRLSMKKHEQLDKDSGMESFQDVSYQPFVDCLHW